MTVGFYAGSFDPFTKRHNEVLEKAVNLFDKVIVAVCVNPAKTRWISVPDAKCAIEVVVDNPHFKGKVEVISSQTQMSAILANKHHATHLIRGIRNSIDYGYEEQLARFNKEISGLDTIYIRADKYGAISSSAVKEMYRCNEDIGVLVPDSIGNTIIELNCT